MRLAGVSYCESLSPGTGSHNTHTLVSDSRSSCSGSGSDLPHLDARPFLRNEFRSCFVGRVAAIPASSQTRLTLKRNTHSPVSRGLAFISQISEEPDQSLLSRSNSEQKVATRRSPSPSYSAEYVNILPRPSEDVSSLMRSVARILLLMFYCRACQRAPEI